MLTSFLWIFSIALNLLFLKNGASAQTSPCPNYFKYQLDGMNIQGIVTLPALKGINNLEVQIVFFGNFDKNSIVNIDIADDDKVARNIFKNGGNIRYKIQFPKNLDKTPEILSIKLNDQQYCDNDNALYSNESYVVLGVNFKVDTGGSRNPQQTTVQPPQAVQPLQAVQPVQLVQPIQPIQSNPSGDNIELDFSNIPPASPSISLPLASLNRKQSNLSDRDWLQTFSSSIQCGRHFTAVHTIINGRELSPNEFPWLVALFNYKRKYFCGGSLISDRHVITAAHCCVQQNWIFLEFGKHALPDSKEPGVLRRISQEIINHPEYKPNTGHGDIALIVISEKVTFSDKIKPICLWPFPAHEIGLKGTVAGWGNDISGSSTDVPMAADVDIVSDQECLGSHNLFAGLTSNTTFCAGGKNKGPCQGDSGAGFIINQNDLWYLKGVISVSLSSNPRAGLCDVNKFAVYCDVGQYLEWLKQYLI